MVTNSFCKFFDMEYYTAIPLAILFVLVWQTLARELQLSQYALPFYWVKRGADLARAIYATIGWLWGEFYTNTYRLLEKIYRILIENLLESIRKTLYEAYDAIEGYFRFGDIVQAFVEVWKKYYPNHPKISEGLATVITQAIISIAIAWYSSTIIPKEFEISPISVFLGLFIPMLLLSMCIN